MIDIGIILSILLLLVSTLAILKVRDNVLAATLLIPAAVSVAALSLVLNFTFLMVLILLIYIGVVITFIIVAASCIEQTSPVDYRRLKHAIPILVVSTIVAITTCLSMRHIMTVHTQSLSLSQLCAIVLNRWLSVVVILLVFLATIALAVIQLAKRS